MSVEAGYPLKQMLNMAALPKSHMNIIELWIMFAQNCIICKWANMKTVEAGSALQQMLNMAGSPT